MWPGTNPVSGEERQLLSLVGRCCAARACRYAHVGTPGRASLDVIGQAIPLLLAGHGVAARTGNVVAVAAIARRLRTAD